MLHLFNDSLNTVALDSALPHNWTFNIVHKQTKREVSYAMTNLLIDNTKSEIFISDLPTGEYIYKAIADGAIYETGVAKIPTKSPTQRVGYSTTKNYKTYVK